MDRDASRAAFERLESLIDAFGADPARWPEGRRAEAERLLAVSREAQELLAEARAFDRLLAAGARAQPPGLAALAGRIAALAEAEPQLAAQPSAGLAAVPGEKGAKIIPLPVGRSRTGAPQVSDAGQSERANAVSIRARLSRPDWRPAAALAASLLMGIAIGLTDLAPTIAAGFASTSETELVLSALQFDGLGGIDEEQI